MSVRDRQPRRPDPFGRAPDATFSRRDRDAVVWIAPVVVPGRSRLRVTGYDPAMDLPEWMADALEDRRAGR